LLSAVFFRRKIGGATGDMDGNEGAGAPIG